MTFKAIHLRNLNAAANLAKPDWDALESDSAGILNKPPLSQSETYDADKAAAGEYVQGQSWVVDSGVLYRLNTDAVLQSARSNSDTVDQTTVPSDGDGSEFDHWVREPFKGVAYWSSLSASEMSRLQAGDVVFDDSGNTRCLNENKAIYGGPLRDTNERDQLVPHNDAVYVMINGVYHLWSDGAWADTGSAVIPVVAGDPTVEPTNQNTSMADDWCYLDYGNSVTPASYGAKAAGADDTFPLRAFAKDATRPLKVIDAGYIALGGGIYFEHGQTVSGAGSITGDVISPSSTTGIWGVVGCRNEPEEIGSATAIKGSSILAVSLNSGVVLSNSDIVLIHNETASSFSNFSTSYQEGDIRRVMSVVDGSTLWLDETMSADHASSKLYRVPEKVINVEWINVKSTGNNSAAVFYGLNNSAVKGVFRGGNSNTVHLVNAFETEIDADSACVAPASGGQYGLAISSCVRLQTEGVYYGTRHGVTHGASPIGLTIPTRDSLIIDAYIDNDHSTNLGSADTHGNADRVTWRNCRVGNGVTIGGSNISVIGGQIDSDTAPAFLITSWLGGDLTLLDFNSDIKRNSAGSLLDGGNAHTAFGADTTKPTNLHIRPQRVEFTGTHTTQTGTIRIRNKGTDEAINVLAEGGIMVNDNNDRYYFISVVSGTAVTEYQQVSVGLQVNSPYASGVSVRSNGY